MIKIDAVNQQKNSKIRSKLTFLLIFAASFQFNAQHEWDVFKVPADAGTGNKWALQTDVSDDFNYTFEATNEDADFGLKQERLNGVIFSITNGLVQDQQYGHEIMSQ